MKIKAILVCLVVFSSFVSLAQPNENNWLVKWDANNKISWDNFVVKDTIDRYAAESNTFFKANFYLKNDSVFCQVITYLNADRSWRKPSLQTDGEYAINHEQIHFDITEIFARRIRKELILNAANEPKVEKIYFDNAKACREFQELYDNETRHSLDKRNQERWNKHVRLLLLSLDNYKEQAIYVKNPWCKICWKNMPALANK
ncbi:MAG: hypothetical protein ABIW38_07605 [Ferruginibacter sp.]